MGTGELGLNQWSKVDPRSWLTPSRRCACGPRDLLKRQIPGPKPLETWAGNLWDNSTMRNSALCLESGCFSAGVGSLTVQTTARVSRVESCEALLPTGTNHGRGRQYCSLGHSCHLVKALDSVPDTVADPPPLCHNPVRQMGTRLLVKGRPSPVTVSA